jgi:hypothetical protein
MSTHGDQKRISRKICLVDKRTKFIRDQERREKKDEKIENLRDTQAVENLTDHVKQLFIHEYRDQLK